MGSRVYAGECRHRRDNITAMICLEMIGFYSEEIGSQWLSLWGPIPAETRGLFGTCSQPGLEAPSQASERHYRARNRYTYQTRDTAHILPGRMEFRSLVVLAGGLPGFDGHRYGAAALSLLSHTRGHPG